MSRFKKTAFSVFILTLLLAIGGYVFYALPPKIDIIPKIFVLTESLQSGKVRKGSIFRVVLENKSGGKSDYYIDIINPDETMPEKITILEDSLNDAEEGKDLNMQVEALRKGSVQLSIGRETSGGKFTEYNLMLEVTKGM